MEDLHEVVQHTLCAAKAVNIAHERMYNALHSLGMIGLCRTEQVREDLHTKVNFIYTPTGQKVVKLEGRLKGLVHELNGLAIEIAREGKTPNEKISGLNEY